MLKLRTSNSMAQPAARVAVSPPPAWAAASAGQALPDRRMLEGTRVSISTARYAALVRVIAPTASAQDGDAFHAATAAAYRAVRLALGASPHRHVVRMWNWIPAIHAPVDGDRDRYMVFNAARFAAMSEWFGGRDQIAANVPAASGVGHDGAELVVHALAMAAPGEAVENPLQVPAYRYSRKYGPRPPCFARATRVTKPSHALLIAGTAAITGEKSCHPGDLNRQFALTLENLRAVLAAGGATTRGGDVLHAMRHVRVYVAPQADAGAAERLARLAFAADADFEFVRADLCRAELLVEIEGAAWDASSPPNQP